MLYETNYVIRDEGSSYDISWETGGWDGTVSLATITQNLGVNDTPVFLLNEYIVELNPANFNILNQILN